MAHLDTKRETMSQHKCRNCQKSYASSLDACPTCGATWLAGDGRQEKFESWKLWPCIECGEPQLCDIGTEVRRRPVCRKHYDGALILTRKTDNEVTRTIRAAYEKTTHYKRLHA